MAAYGLYTHIQSNRRRSIALLIGLFFLVYLMVFAGALLAEGSQPQDLPAGVILQAALRDLLFASPWATLGLLLWILVAYHFHQALIDTVTGGREISRQEAAPELWNLLENLCISRGITMPRLKMMESDALNAFTTGLNDKQYSITVTTGLVNALDAPEVEAVLGHELTHIRNGDVRLLVIALIIAGVFSFFTELLYRILVTFSWSGGSRDDRRSSGGGTILVLLALLLVAIAWFLSLVIRLALSRSREYLADAGSVELTKNPDAMISALRKIEGRGEIERAPSAVMEMCVDNPREGFTDLFSTHPSVEKRTEALVKFAGGHDPGPIAALSSAEGAVPTAAPSPWGDAPSSRSHVEGSTAAGPWGGAGADRSPSPHGPFLPPRPPIGLGDPNRKPGGTSNSN